MDRIQIDITSMSSFGYPKFSTMKATFLVPRLSSELNLVTKVVRVVKNSFRGMIDALSGWAAINQDGHGVGTEPI